MYNLHTYNGNVIDFQTCGSSPSSYPIEIAVVLFNGTIYHSLIKPPSNWHYWSMKSEKIHGISREMLENCGKSFNDVCVDLNEVCGGHTIFCDRWEHDSMCLKKLYAAADLSPSFKLSPIGHLLDEADLNTWHKDKSKWAAKEGMDLNRAMSNAYLIKCMLDNKFLDDHNTAATMGRTLGHKRGSGLKAMTQN